MLASMPSGNGPAAPAAPAILSGAGVHSGIPCRLELRMRDGLPTSAGSGKTGAGTGNPGGSAASGSPGPEFLFPGFPHPASIADLAALPIEARRATVLGREGARIETPEHALAALLFFPGAPLSLRADAAELPGLDGSALPFRDALAGLVPAAAAKPAWREYPCGLIWSERWDGGSISIRPADRFRVRYEIERGPLRQAFELEDARAAWDGILPARTFAFHSEWRAALSAGLMAGAAIDSGLLLAESEEGYRAALEAHPEWPGGPYPLLNQASWRFPDEPVRHKILDLLGDLALNGLALPRASIEVRNGGHAAHHRLLARLREC